MRIFKRITAWWNRPSPDYVQYSQWFGGHLDLATLSTEQLLAGERYAIRWAHQDYWLAIYNEAERRRLRATRDSSPREDIRRTPNSLLGKPF